MSGSREKVTQEIASLAHHADALNNAWQTGHAKRIALNIDYIEGVLSRAKSLFAKDLYRNTLADAMHTERMTDG